MKKLSVFSLLIILSIISEFGCKSPTGPANRSSDIRDYTWTADTIKTMDPLTLSRIWGVTPNDVWAVGTGAATALLIWHYDGKKWDCDSVARGFTPWAVIGYSSNEIWIGNNNSEIWKYNGTKWQLYGNYNLDGYSRVVIQNFDGLSANDIYGVGYAEIFNTGIYKGIIIHYDGKKWEEINIPDKKIGIVDGKIDEASGTLILEATEFDPAGWVNKVCTWDGKELKEIYSGYPYAHVGSVQHEVLVDIQQKIYKYEDGKLVLWKDLTGTDYDGKVWCGRNENDFFICSSTGMAHYNGTDIKTIYKTNLTVEGGYVFDKDVFFIFTDINKVGVNVVVHGKLN